MTESPEGEAAAKLAQHLVVAAQIAEAVVRMRQQSTDRRTAHTSQAAASLRAERHAQHAADRVVFTRGDNPQWIAKADLSDLGRVWGAAAGWSDTDPVADRVTCAVEDRLSEMAPAAMARYETLRDDGVDRAEAFRRVAAESPARVFVTEPVTEPAATAEANARAGAAEDEARADAGIRDDVSTPTVDEHAEGAADAREHRAEATSARSDAETARATERQVEFLTDLVAEHPDRIGADSPCTADDFAALSREEASTLITTWGGGPPVKPRPRPVDIAARSHPEPLTTVHPAGRRTGRKNGRVARPQSRTPRR